MRQRLDEEAEERALAELATTFPNDLVEPRRRPLKDAELERVRKLDPGAYEEP